MVRGINNQPLSLTVPDRDFGELYPGIHVFKLGRRSLRTSGIYNGLRDARIAGNGKLTWEHSIIRQKDSSEPFSKPGDCGAFVWNYDGVLLGLCFGGHLDGSVSYFIHTHDLFDDIEARTGAVGIQLRVSGDLAASSSLP